MGFETPHAFRQWQAVVCLWQIVWKGKTYLAIIDYKETYVLIKLDPTNISKHMHVLVILSQWTNLKKVMVYRRRNRSNKKDREKEKKYLTVSWRIQQTLWNHEAGRGKKRGRQVGHVWWKAHGKIVTWVKNRLVRNLVSWHEFANCFVCLCCLFLVLSIISIRGIHAVSIISSNYKNLATNTVVRNVYSGFQSNICKILIIVVHWPSKRLE